MKLQLGNFTQESISAFKDPMGEECMFQDYLKSHGLCSSKFYIYLMSTLTGEEGSLPGKEDPILITIPDYLARRREGLVLQGEAAKSNRLILHPPSEVWGYDGNKLIIGYKCPLEQRKAIKQLFEKKDLLAVLPTCYGKSLIFQLLVLLARAEDETACLLGYNPTLKHN
ncbi:hypothetical protein OS493_024062 [Desmophyllum pertusum]|uniref:DEAD/DEAH box helicase domain-containing protein n=1 Tax=Desmophyllum pertusum TaxID=174260 RepID=A0A9W9ZLQ6_9CNID|nr:hypothetical protein OS493_024062 [Desmophyllum pertusum]